MFRDPLGPADLHATLSLIHSVGYATVETYPLVYNRPARELKALIEGIGLKAPSGHFDYDTPTNPMWTMPPSWALNT